MPSSRIGTAKKVKQAKSEKKNNVKQRCKQIVEKIGNNTFTSLNADLRQDKNRGIAFSRCLNGIFPGRKCSVKALVSQLRKRRFVLVSFYSSHLGKCTNILTEKFLQGNVPLRHLLNEETLFMY